MARKTVLIDMDNTLADFDGAFAVAWSAAGAGLAASAIASRKHFELEANFAAGGAGLAAALKVMAAPGLFASFAPTPGSVAAVRAMVAAGLDVFFCTAPLPAQYETCVAEKYAWVRRHYGEAFLKRVVVTRDKTLVRGDVLIDDKPLITGVKEPEWVHFIYPQSYNQEAEGRRFGKWEDWRETLGEFIDL